jgi:hypothetical protein
MKALMLFLVFSLVMSNAFAKSSACSVAAGKAAKQMYLGTSSTKGRSISTRSNSAFDDNSALVFKVVVTEQISDDEGEVESTKYKVVARGNQSECQIISATEVSN